MPNQPQSFEEVVQHRQKEELEFLQKVKDAFQRGKEENEEMLHRLDGQIKPLAVAGNAGVLGDRQANSRVRYRDQGYLARHYSEVRMHTGTFLIGISLGILVLAHDKDDPKLVGMAIVVWAVMVTVFGYFTLQENRKSAYQHMTREELFGEKTRPDPGLLKEPGFRFILLLTVVFVIAAVIWSVEIWQNQHRPAQQQAVKQTNQPISKDNKEAEPKPQPLPKE